MADESGEDEEKWIFDTDAGLCYDFICTKIEIETTSTEAMACCRSFQRVAGRCEATERNNVSTSTVPGRQWPGGPHR